MLLVRHGARFDYENKESWREACARLGHNAADPPLSALGHRQARETAAVLSGEAIEHILVSPYLRVIQTAQPLSHAMSLPLCIEDGLSELGHVPDTIPLPGSRFPYFPEIDDKYIPMHPPIEMSPSGREGEVAYLQRMLRLAADLPKRFPRSTVACFSHAASVALVAALTKSKTLDEAGTFAPCGIWKLVSLDDGASWQVEARGDDNQGHVTENSPSTFPWGFRHSATSTASKTGLQEWEQRWTEAQCMGPTVS